MLQKHIVTKVGNIQINDTDKLENVTNINQNQACVCVGGGVNIDCPTTPDHLMCILRVKIKKAG